MHGVVWWAYPCDGAKFTQIGPTRKQKISKKLPESGKSLFLRGDLCLRDASVGARSQRMDFESAFPLRFWINLGRREDRRAEMETRLAVAGITAERFPGVDARGVAGWDNHGAGRPGNGLAQDASATLGAADAVRGYESAGRYALALTQRLALREAGRRKASAVLLLEDDQNSGVRLQVSRWIKQVGFPEVAATRKVSILNLKEKGLTGGNRENGGAARLSCAIIPKGRSDASKKRSSIPPFAPLRCLLFKI